MPAEFPRWALMWGLALAVFAGFKALTLALALQDGCRLTWGRGLGYLALWPGMEPRAFAGRGPAAPAAAAEWAGGLGNSGLGVALVLAGARLTESADPRLAGWAGMVGLVFTLHFGVFRLLGLAWRAAGVDAQPLMSAPHRSESLAEFWGRRWNSAFRDLAFGLLFSRIVRRTGVVGATFVVFLASGLIHDLVISWPAGGGYGLPTAYFLLQACGLLAERSRPGRRWGLGAGAPGRAFTFLCAAAPAYWLFHPPFVVNVVVPFLRALGPLGGSHGF